MVVSDCIAALCHPRVHPDPAVRRDGVWSAPLLQERRPEAVVPHSARHCSTPGSNTSSNGQATHELQPSKVSGGISIKAKERQLRCHPSRPVMASLLACSSSCPCPDGSPVIVCAHLPFGIGLFVFQFAAGYGVCRFFSPHTDTHTDTNRHTHTQSQTHTHTNTNTVCWFWSFILEGRVVCN